MANSEPPTGPQSVTVKTRAGKSQRIKLVNPGDASEPVRVRQDNDLPIGMLMDAGHGVLIESSRDPWKSPVQTRCVYCGGPLPMNLSHPKYRCEFDPGASPTELDALGEMPSPPENDCRHDVGCRCDYRGCDCQGCTLRRQVMNGHERASGQPRKYCGQTCRRAADAERKRHLRAVERAGTDSGIGSGLHSGIARGIVPGMTKWTNGFLVRRIPTTEELNNMTDEEYKVLENWARRSARRQGLRLEKSRARDPRAVQYGTYQLVDESSNALVASGLSNGFGLGLDDVLRSLSES